MGLSFWFALGDWKARCRQSSQTMNGRVRRCLENRGVEQRGLADELIDRDIEDVDDGDDNVVGWARRRRKTNWILDRKQLSAVGRVVCLIFD